MSVEDKTRKMRGRQSEPRLGKAIRSDNLRPPKLDPERPLPTARGVLSAAEIEALLRPDLPEPAPVSETVNKDVPDFAETSREDRERAERLMARLSLCLRRESELPLALSVNGMSRQAWRRGLPDPGTGAAFLVFGDNEGNVEAVVCIAGALAAGLVDAACGAEPELVSAARPRGLTEIDVRLLSRLFEPVARLLPGGELLCVETRRAFALALMPPGEAHVIDLGAEVDGLSGAAHVLLGDWPTPPQAGIKAPLAGEQVPRGPDGLMALLTARIASLSVPVSRLSDLKPGDTLLLGVPADEPVQLLSGGRDGALVAEGEVGRKGLRMAVRVRQRTNLLR